MSKLQELLEELLVCETSVLDPNDAAPLAETLVDQLEPGDFIPAVIEYLEGWTNDMGAAFDYPETTKCFESACHYLKKSLELDE